MILAHHIGFNSVITKSFGDFAVSLFFILSGFVLTLAYHERVRKGEHLPYLPFLTRRVAKIYPLYLVTMILAWLLPGHYGGAEAILPDILMLQSWFPAKTIYFSGNAIGWFVSDIMFCYMLFLPVLRFMLFRRRMFYLSAGCVAVVYFLIVALVPDSAVTTVVYILPPMQFPSFLIGMWLATVTVDRSDATIPSAIWANTMVILAVGLTVVMIILYPAVTKRLTLSSYWWFPSACLIAALALTDNAKTLITRLLHGPILIKAGDLSYPFFLLHIPYLHLTRPILSHLGIHLTPLCEFLTATLILFPLSHLANRYFASPLDRRIRTLLHRS